MTGGIPGRGAAYGHEIRVEIREVQRTRVSQGPRERSAALGGVQAGRVGVHPRTSPARPVTGVGSGGHLPADLGHDHS